MRGDSGTRAWLSRDRSRCSPPAPGAWSRVRPRTARRPGGPPAAQEVRPQGFCGSLSQCDWISVGKRSRAPRPCSSPRLSVCGRQEGRCARTQSQPCHSPAVWQVTDFLEASSWVTSHGGSEDERSRAGCTLSLRLSRARGGPAWTTGGRPPGLRAPVLSNALCRLPS